MRRRLWGLLLIAALAAPATGAAQGQAIRVGLAVAIKSDIALYGDPIRNGFLIAFRQFNERRLILIDPIIEDTGGSRDGAIDAFQKLIRRDEVAVILGPVLSSQAFAADPLAVQAQLFFHRQVLCRERFIYFNQINVIEREPRLLQRNLRRRHRTPSHQLRLNPCNPPTHNPPQR